MPSEWRIPDPMLPFQRLIRFVPLCLVLIALMLSTTHHPAAAQGDNPLSTQVKLLVPEVIAVYERDPSTFTQGFLLYNGQFYESAGLYGQSSLRQIDRATGQIVQSISLPETYFAEGLERVENRLIQLTWKENVAFIYDLATFKQMGTFEYQGEGWGLCYDGRLLYMSDGSPFISLRDPDTFELIFQGLVTLQGSPVLRLNELECVGDYIYANVWKTDYILQIDKFTGVVVGLIDASQLLTAEEKAALNDQQVLNGIAYNAEADTFLITGKQWPKIFEVRFVEVEQ